MTPIMNELVSFLVSFSKQQLTKYGEFYSHAARVNTRDEIEVVGVHMGDDHPQSETLIQESAIFFAEARNQRINAAAICSDVKIALPDGATTDAIRVELEHKDGDSLIILTPYLLQQNRAISFGLPIVEKRGEGMVPMIPNLQD